MRSAGTADELALGEIEDDASGLSGPPNRGVVVEVVVVVFARRSRGAGAGGVQDASVVFAVEVEEVVVEVFFKDAHGHFLA